MCKLGLILEASKEDTRGHKLLVKAIADPETWPADSLSLAIKKTDYSVGSTTIKAHRRQECGCFQ